MKKTHYKSLVAAAIIASFTQTAFADTLAEISADQDTWTNDTNVTQLNGSTSVLRIDTPKMRAFVQFTVTDIPAGHVVDTATLTLTASKNQETMPDTFIAPVSGAWDEGVLTAENDDVLLAGVGATIATATNIAAEATVDFDLSTAFSSNGTYTFLINLADKDVRSTKYESSKSFAKGPKLNITTKPDPGAPAGDTRSPEFSADILAIEINATGTKTDISSLININATDETDGVISATVVGDSSLISGAHIVTLQATDAAGNVATKDIDVNITPLIILTAPETLELPAGASASASVALSGPAVSYPVTIDYTVSGDATNDISDTLTFTAENYSNAQSVDITLAGDAQGKQSALLTLTQVSNVQTSDETVIVSTVDGNLAPSLTLTLTQAGETITTISAENVTAIPYIDATKGAVTVTLAVEDFNSNDTHTLAWPDSSEEFAASGEIFEFSPADLSGDFMLSVSATENNTTEKHSTLLATTIRIIKNGLPDLIADKDSDGDGIADIDEGFNDSDGDGIVDYLDDNADTTKLPLAEGQKSLQTLPGLTLSLGSVSTSTQSISTSSAVISAEDLASSYADLDTTDTGFLAIEGANLFNFTVSGLNNGATAPVVYPLPNNVVITDETEYRKYTPAVGWTTFVTDSDNSIASAEKDENGNCPLPNDAIYLDGLTPGDNCVQLTIKDGGIYDADGVENGSVEDPGVLAQYFELIQWSTDTIQLPATNVNEGSNVSLTKDLTTLVGDADASTLTFSVESDANWLTIDEAGLLTAEVSKLAEGEHSAQISFTSESAQTGQARVKVAVTFNSAPKLATAELVAASRNEAYSASIAEFISDADGDAYTIEKVAGPYWLKVSEAGELSGTPLKANIGDNNVTVKLIDDKGATTQASFNVPVNDSGVRASDGGSFSAGLLSLLALFSLRRKNVQK